VARVAVPLEVYENTVPADRVPAGPRTWSPLWQVEECRGLGNTVVPL